MQQLMLFIPSFLGISAEVYIIVLVSAVPIFFFFIWRKLLRRFIKSANTLAVISALAAIITSPFVYLIAAGAFFAMLVYYPKHEFDKQKWLVDKEHRYEMSADIIQSGILLGKTQQEVKQLLGDEYENLNGQWECYLGFVPSLGGLDPDVLDIYFENNKVIKVGQHET